MVDTYQQIFAARPTQLLVHALETRVTIQLLAPRKYIRAHISGGASFCAYTRKKHLGEKVETYRKILVQKNDRDLLRALL